MNSIRLFKLYFCTFFLFSSLFSQPTVSEVSPNFGPTMGGNVVSIVGTGFLGTTSVFFGSKPAIAFNATNDNEIIAIAPVGTPQTINISITTPTGISLGTKSSSYTYQGVWFAYATQFNSNTVVAINTDTNVPGPFVVVGNSPSSVAITPDGTTAYINVSGLNSLVAVDIATNTIIGAPIPVGSNPSGIAISADGTAAYVTNTGSNSVTPINLTTNPPTPGVPIPVGLNPIGITITTDGLKAYVVNTTSNTATIIDLVTQTPIGTIPVGPRPVAATTAPNGARVYITHVNMNAVTEIDVATNAVLRVINLTGPGVNAITITSESDEIYVTNTFDASLTPYNLVTNTIEPNIVTDTRPDALAFTPDQTRAYVAHESSNNVVVIDLTQNPPVRILNIPVGNRTGEIAITPDQAPFAFFSITPALVGSASIFDASKSVSPVGSIASYNWDFGDGFTTSTTLPIIGHVYANPGIYNVTLTVINTAGTSTFQIFTGQTMRNNGGLNAIDTRSVNIISPAPLPPSNFVGILKKNKFLNRTEYILSTRWNPSSSLDVVFYRIYNNGNLVAIIPAGGPLVFVTCLDSKNSANNYQIVAVNSNNVESSPILLGILYE